MIYLITGGARSGKSTFAQQLALDLSENPVYVATARHWDDEFKQRIRRHQLDRDDRWESFEVEKTLSLYNYTSRVVVVDCITLWLTNYFTDLNQDLDKCLEIAKSELRRLFQQEAAFIFVTNELGMGLHADTPTGRKFVDLQGWINQFIASRADYVYLMVSGIPVPVKEKKMQEANSSRHT